MQFCCTVWECRLRHLSPPRTKPTKKQANDLNELKKLQKPSDIIKLIFDCVGLLKMEKVQPVQVDEITIGIGKEKQTLPFLKVTGIGYFRVFPLFGSVRILLFFTKDAAYYIAGLCR